MKKLMIAVAVVALAAVSQAAQIAWNSDVIVLPDGKTEAEKGDVSGYLFMLSDKAAYDAYASYLTDGEALSKKIWADYGTSLGTADAQKNSGNNGEANLIVKDAGTGDPKDYAAGTYYAAILYTTGEGDNLYYMGNVGTAVVGGTSDVDVEGLSKKITGVATGTVDTAWATNAVPEPTSGLLLLLGVAGLALRRRRA